METNKFAEKTIITYNSELLKKQRCGKSVVISMIIILISILAILAATQFFTDSSSSAYMALMTIGISGLCVGLVKVLFGDNKMMFMPTKSPLKKMSVFFKPDEIITLERFLDDRNFEGLTTIASEHRSAGVRLDVAISKDKKFATCQIFKFIPHSYQPTCQVMNLEETDIANFDNIIKGIYSKQ